MRILLSFVGVSLASAIFWLAGPSPGSSTVPPRVGANQSANVKTPVPAAAAADVAPEPGGAAPSKPSPPSDVVVLSPEELLNKIRVALAGGSEVDRETVVTTLLPVLVLQSPGAAAKLAESLGPGPWRERVLQVVAEGWVGLDAERALTWAAALPIPAERDTARTAGYLQLARSDPGRSLQLMEIHGLEKSGYLQENLVQQWAEKNAVAAEAWIGSHPAADPPQDQRLARLALGLAKTSPAEAAALVADRIPQGPVQTEAAISVVHQWGVRDPGGARAWVASFPEGELRRRANLELEGMAAYRSAAGDSVR